MGVKTRALRKHLTLSSCIVVRRRTRRASSYMVSARHTSTSHFVVRYCASPSLYLAVVRCRRQVTKQTIVFWVNA